MLVERAAATRRESRGRIMERYNERVVRVTATNLTKTEGSMPGPTAAHG